VRGGDDHRVAGPWLAYVEQADVRREPRCADDVESQRRGLEPRRNGPEGAAACHRVLLPAELADDELSRLEARVAARDDFAQRLRGDHVSELQRPGVGAPLAHASPLIGIERDVQGPDVHLPRPRLGNLRFVE
jgi:hypothetical protein